jgi:SAM-dependent methyltransferase
MSDLQSPEGPNAAQAEYWTSAAGPSWALFQNDLDVMHEGVSARLIETAAPVAGETVLDIGCGAGATSMALATAVGPGGSVLGIDISSTLLDRAEQRRKEAGLENVQYVLTDAQTHPFAPDGFDLVISRFGVMFFADPVAAFQNLLAALRPGARLAFASWAEAGANPWFTLPKDVAARVLGEPAPTPPRAAGPLAFAETDYVLGILQQAGFSDCAFERTPIGLFHPGGVEAVMRLVPVVGPVARIVREFDGSADDVEKIMREVAVTMRQYETDGGVRIPATINIFTASKS